MIQKNWQELIKPNKLEIVQGSGAERRATIVAEPLERGFGLTLGNALRRVLLSSLQGSPSSLFINPLILPPPLLGVISLEIAVCPLQLLGVG